MRRLLAILMILSIGLTASACSAGTNSVLPAVGDKFGQAPTYKWSGKAAPKELTKEIVVQGKGEKIKAGDTLVINYAGSVWDKDTLFDSSYKRGEPAVFSLQHLIKGWSEALVGVPVGSRIVFSVPPELGYGKTGNANAGISGEDVLVFTVDVIARVDASVKAEGNATATNAQSPVTVESKVGEPIEKVSIVSGYKTPTQLKSTVLAKGSGAALNLEKDKTKFLVLHYAQLDEKGTIVGSTWKDKAPLVLSLKNPVDLITALNGVNIGSRVLLEVPANNGAPSAIFVIDIVKIV